MIRLPEIVDPTLQRLMSERILILMEYHEMLDGSVVHEEVPALFPPYTPLKKAQYEWESFRKLLRHKYAYTPELIQEYLLNSLCEMGVDMIKEGILTLDRFPAEERTQLVDKYGEETVASYEDLRNYKDTLFWDTDFAFLDSMSERALEVHPMSEALGITGANEMRFELGGREVKMKNRPWEV